MSRRICCIMSVLCFAALFLAACGGGGGAQPTAAAPTTAAAASTTAASVSQAATAAPTEAPTPEPTATTPPTVEPIAVPAQPVELSGTKIDMNNPIFKAYFAVYSKFPRRTRIESFNPKTQQTFTMLAETDAKDHLSIEIGGMSGTDGITTSLVIISPTMYLKQGATWQKLPGAQSAMMLSMLADADSLLQMLNAFDELASYTVKPIGPEDVNGVPAMAYSSEFTLKDGKTSKGKAWLGLDGLLMKDMVETSDGATVTTTYEFDPNIKVQAPIP